MATYWENRCSFGLRYVSWYKYLTVSLVFSHLGFWSGNLFLIAPFPDLCLLVTFNKNAYWVFSQNGYAFFIFYTCFSQQNKRAFCNFYFQLFFVFLFRILYILLVLNCTCLL